MWNSKPAPATGDSVHGALLGGQRGLKPTIAAEPIGPISRGKSLPDIGDYVVSPANHVLAVMVDGSRALVLDESILTKISQTVSAANKDKFPSASEKWKKGLSQ